MKPVSLEVDGRIDLLDGDHAANQAPRDQSSSNPNGDDAARARRSRLNDVMIVLERDRETLQTALKERMLRTMPAMGIEALSLTLDQQAPEFHIAMTSSGTQSRSALAPDQKAALETEIAAEIFSAIQSRAAVSGTRRWQPSVTATLRADLRAQKASTPMHSIWFKTLLWLLAIVILGTAYLYLKGMPA